MKIVDQLFILKRQLIKKDNIIMMIILVLLFLVIFACVTMINFANFFRTSISENKKALTMFIYKPDDEEKMELLKHIDHIVSIESKKYADSVQVSSPQFTKNDIDGTVLLMPLLNLEDVNIISGRSLQNSGEIICPSKFYPYSLYVDEFDKKMYSSLMIDSRNLIGKDITISEDKEYKFNVVGSFSNNILEELNVCYVSKDDFDIFKSDIEFCDDEKCYEYNSLMVRVDSSDNFDYVKKELIDMGFSPIDYYNIDEEMLLSLTYIPLFTSSIIIIISITIIYNFFKKKSFNSQYQQGILRSIGYKKRDIISLYILDGIIIFFISMILNFVLYLLGYFIITEFYLDEVSYYNLSVPIPWFYILSFSIFSLGYILLVINACANRNLNMCVQKLFEK